METYLVIFADRNNLFKCVSRQQEFFGFYVVGLVVESICDESPLGLVRYFVYLVKSTFHLVVYMDLMKIGIKKQTLAVKSLHPQSYLPWFENTQNEKDNDLT